MLGLISVSRLLNWLRSAFPSDTVVNKHKNYRYIPIEITKDLKWWYEFLPVFNGVSMMAVEEWSYPDTDNFCHAIFPPFITEQNLHINCLELLTIVVSFRTWGK